MKQESAKRLNIVLPVYNEEQQICENATRLLEFLDKHCPYEYLITIADNGSTDRTFLRAEGLVVRNRIALTRVSAKGRGRALREAWLSNDAEVQCYMDIDLSTDLCAFVPLVSLLMTGSFDLAIGSRLLKRGLTTRGLKREVISRCYNALLRAIFRPTFCDAQCGFKAITREAARQLLPLVEDDRWFFDTELLLLSDLFGYRIYELPVLWRDDPDSRVRIWRTAYEDIRGICRLWRKFKKSGYLPRVLPGFREGNALLGN